MAEHMAKAIICGLDAVALDTAPLVALQIRFTGECTDPENSHLVFNNKITSNWGVQRLKNLLASWHNQMLEIAGAMGIREVRRMRGEMGRAMFQKELEQDAFGGIKGYG
jgi:glutamate synthase domain-containing protein 2